MQRDYYKIDGYHATIGSMIESLQRVAKNIGEDSPCFYTITTFQDTVRWGDSTYLTDEMANDIVNNLWYYPEIGQTIRKAIENELHIQLGEKNLTLEDFTY